MIDAQLQAIRERWAQAAPGPWHETDLPDGTLRVSFVALDAEGCVPDTAPLKWAGYVWWAVIPGSMEEYDGADLANARAIAAAPTDVAELLTEVERLKALLRLATRRYDQ